MFDLSSGTIDRPFRDRHPSATVVSLAAHAAAVAIIVWVVLYSIADTLPVVPTMMAFVAEAPVPSPPPPPPAAARVTPARSTPSPAAPNAFVAPLEVPSGVQPEPAIDLSDEGGVVGGVEGGLPGGVLGGVLGGMVSEVAPPPPPPAKPRRIGGALKPPAQTVRVEPDYPGVAVSARVGGTVILEATVDEQGQVSDVRVLRSIPLLDRAAMAAVRQWRYEPLLLNGVPTPFILTVTVTFSLR